MQNLSFVSKKRKIINFINSKIKLLMHYIIIRNYNGLRKEKHINIIVQVLHKFSKSHLAFLEFLSKFLKVNLSKFIELL